MNKLICWLNLAVLLCAVIPGCTREPEYKKWGSGNTFCEYSEDGRIFSTKILDYDAYLEPFVFAPSSSSSSIRPGYSFKFYNYGGNFRIFNSARDDTFVGRYSSFDILGIYQKEDISDISILQLERYGRYGTCLVKDKDHFMKTYKQVYITPTTLRYLDDYNSEKGLLLVRFFEDWQNLELFVLFTLSGSDWSNYIVSYYPNAISTNSDMSQFEINSQISSRIRSDQEQKQWEAKRQLDLTLKKIQSR